MHVAQAYMHTAHKTARSESHRSDITYPENVAIFDALRMDGRDDGNQNNKKASDPIKDDDLH